MSARCSLEWTSFSHKHIELCIPFYEVGSVQALLKNKVFCKFCFKLESYVDVSI